MYLYVCVETLERSKKIRIVFYPLGADVGVTLARYGEKRGEDFLLVTILNFLAFEPCESIVHSFLFFCFFNKEGMASNQTW